MPDKGQEIYRFKAQRKLWAWFLAILLVFGYLLLRGLLRDQRKTSVDRETLIQTATEYARKNGRRVEDYEVASVIVEKGLGWILFNGKSGLPGDHFSVKIDLSTGQALELFPGE